MSPLDKILECIEKKRDFVLQGGAGSGKTETLSQLISAITLMSPAIRIACITHTNKAADEIASRTLHNHSVSTIHAFINKLISNHQKNIHSVISKLFEIESLRKIERKMFTDDKTHKAEEYKQYKKIFEKYSTRFYTVRNVRLDKVEGKKIYDAEPQRFNQELDLKIIELNSEIRSLVEKKDYRSIEYNETRFNNFRDLTYGHDGLLHIAEWLFEKFPLLGKILSDKYDCVFIDEYQDTDEKIVKLFLNLKYKEKTTIGFFGDSMQAIYGSGIGSLEPFVGADRLIKIEKEDNYRCSQQVISFINSLRDDDLKQQVAFKVIEGKVETLADRQGGVEFYYSIFDDKPHSRSSVEELVAYDTALENLVAAASFEDDSKTLLLSNKAVAGKAGFSQLYRIFSDRYLEPKEEIEKVLTRLQLLDLFEICQAYQSKNYNFVLTKLKKSGLSVRNISDKKVIAASIQSIVESKESAIDTVKRAFECKLLKKSDTFSEFINRAESTLLVLSNDDDFKKFEADYIDDGHTFLKMSKKRADLDEDYFDEQVRNIERRNFYRDLLSEKFAFLEVLNYFRYEDEQTPFITMHKTKGTGINNVLVVLDEYFWNEYNFGTIFDREEANVEKRLKNLKLIYVACSRTKQNLRCARLVSSDEKEKFLVGFKDFKVIEVQ